MTSVKKPTATSATDAKVAVENRTDSRGSGSGLSPEEIAEVRAALDERLGELRREHEAAIIGLSTSQRERLADSAGDDEVDLGTKTVEREQEISLANNVRDRLRQVERALERLDEGDYGICERCAKPIPAARLAAFPSVTLCVNCKSLEERR